MADDAVCCSSTVIDLGAILTTLEMPNLPSSMYLIGLRACFGLLRSSFQFDEEMPLSIFKGAAVHAINSLVNGDAGIREVAIAILFLISERYIISFSSTRR